MAKSFLTWPPVTVPLLGPDRQTSSVAPTKRSTLKCAALHQLVLSVERSREGLRRSCVHVATPASEKRKSRWSLSDLLSYNLSLKGKHQWLDLKWLISVPCHPSTCHVALARDGTISTWGWKAQHQTQSSHNSKHWATNKHHKTFPFSLLLKVYFTKLEYHGFSVVFTLAFVIIIYNHYN